MKAASTGDYVNFVGAHQDGLNGTRISTLIPPDQGRLSGMGPAECRQQAPNADYLPGLRSCSPPTFIGTIYGMNFEDVPELAWPLGYPFAIALMLAMGIVLYLVFKRRKWL